MTTATNRPDVVGNVGRVGAVIAIAIALCALSAAAQTAKEVKGATPLVAVPNEAPAKLIVDQPIPEQLALGRVFIQYRTENLRILPVYGNAALAVSPRLGHLHYFVDGQSWPPLTRAAKRWSSSDYNRVRTRSASNWRMRRTNRFQVPPNWWSSQFPLGSSSG